MCEGAKENSVSETYEDKSERRCFSRDKVFSSDRSVSGVTNYNTVLYFVTRVRWKVVVTPIGM